MNLVQTSIVAIAIMILFYIVLSYVLVETEFTPSKVDGDTTIKGGEFVSCDKTMLNSFIHSSPYIKTYLTSFDYDYGTELTSEEAIVVVGKAPIDSVYWSFSSCFITDDMVTSNSDCFTMRSFKELTINDSVVIVLCENPHTAEYICRKIVRDLQPVDYQIACHFMHLRRIDADTKHSIMYNCIVRESNDHVPLNFKVMKMHISGVPKSETEWRTVVPPISKYDERALFSLQNWEDRSRSMAEDYGTVTSKMQTDVYDINNSLYFSGYTNDATHFVSNKITLNAGETLTIVCLDHVSSKKAMYSCLTWRRDPTLESYKHETTGSHETSFKPQGDPEAKFLVITYKPDSTESFYIIESVYSGKGGFGPDSETLLPMQLYITH